MASVTTAAPKAPFWERQFAPQASAGQVLFDLVAGAVLPVVCLATDPAVFRNGASRSPYFPNHGLLAYSVIGVAVFALITWLLLQRGAGLLAGFLAVGALFAALLGLALLPLSLIGLLFYGVGIFGFAPFVTAFVFGRNAVRAGKAAAARQGAARACCALCLGLVAAVVVPLGLHRYLQFELDRAAVRAGSADEAEAERGIQTLR
jgi:hypothetical protein